MDFSVKYADTLAGMYPAEKGLSHWFLALFFNFYLKIQIDGVNVNFADSFWMLMRAMSENMKSFDSLGSLY